MTPPLTLTGLLAAVCSAVVVSGHAAAAAPSLRVCTVEGDPPGVHAAAQKLRGWVESAGSACRIQVNVLNITHESDGCLALGPGAADLAPAFRFPTIQDGSVTESYAMQAARPMYVLTGNPKDDSGRAQGTYFAALEFAERIGVRFLTSDAIAVTKNATICHDIWSGLPDAYHYSPPLEYRNVLAWDVDQHKEFASSKRFNAPELPYATPPGFVHTSYKLLNATANNAASSVGELWNTHNEWFWPRKNSDPTGSVYGQLCWSNSSLVAYVTKQVLAFLHAQPDASVISVSQNDNYNFCNSSAERAVYDAEGGAKIGPLLRAVNVIADAVRNEFPSRSVSIDTLAYQWTRAAPTVTLPRKNVIVRLCSIECNFGAPLSDPSNAKFQTDIVNWGQKSNRTWIWNYVTDFANYVMPWPDYYNLAPNTLFYMKHGVSGIFQEAAYQSTGSDLAPMKTYLMSKLLWDPENTRVNATVSEFLELYYGESVVPRLIEYMNLWSNAVRDSKFYLGESVPYTSAYLTPENLLRSAALMEPAPGDDASKAMRLRTAKMSTLYVVLLRWDEVRDYANAHGVKWPYKETTLQAAFQSFSSIYKESRVTQLSEAGHDLAWLKKAAKVPSFPSI